MRGKIRGKALLGAAFCAASVVGMGAGSAFAGEVTGSGQGGPTEIPGVTGAPSNGNSSCLFSGLEDDEPPTGPGNVQNWGHVKKANGLSGGANGPIPGPHGDDGCNARDFGRK
jgi:hypothetical protein